MLTGMMGRGKGNARWIMAFGAGVLTALLLIGFDQLGG